MGQARARVRCNIKGNLYVFWQRKEILKEQILERYWAQYSLSKACANSSLCVFCPFECLIIYLQTVVKIWGFDFLYGF